MGQLKQIWQCDDKEIILTRYLVHKFKIGDVDEPDLYAAQEVDRWINSDLGQWIKKQSVKPLHFTSNFDHPYYGYQYAIFAYLTNVQITYFELKYK